MEIRKVIHHWAWYIRDWFRYVLNCCPIGLGSSDCDGDKCQWLGKRHYCHY
jgi:hypothetical protein